MRTKSLMNYMGGKAKLAKWLLGFFPEHDCYVEPFGGAGTLLFNKTPAKVEIYNDIDSAVVNLFEVLRDKESFETFKLRVEMTPCSREVYMQCKGILNESDDKVERAVAIFILYKQGFAGQPRAWGTSKFVSHAKSWINTVRNLDYFHNRLIATSIECLDWKEIIRKYDDEKTFFYIDPPYFHSNKKTDRYRYGLSAIGHEELIHTLQGIKGKFLLSGYENPLYGMMKSNSKITMAKRETKAYGVAKTEGTGISDLSLYKRIECVWYNYILNEIEE